MQLEYLSIYILSIMLLFSSAANSVILSSAIGLTLASELLSKYHGISLSTRLFLSVASLALLILDEELRCKRS